MGTTTKPFDLQKANVLLATAGFFFACFLSGCAKQPYIAKPLSPQHTSAKIANKNPLSIDFKAFCQRQGYTKALPFEAWGLDELTLSALYHHTKLDVSKAQLGVAKAAIESAGLKTAPSLGANVARSNRANGDIRPFAYGLNVEIPIETGNKRQLRIEEAQQLAEAARLDVAETAWQLRSQLAKDWLDYQQHVARVTVLQTALTQQQNYQALMQKRLNLGLASSAEVALANTQLAKMQTNLSAEKNKKAMLINQLAIDAGLSLASFEQIKIASFNIETQLQISHAFFADAKNLDDLQAQALLNRIDLRRSLANYAAAETRIKLEVAKQTPDFAITPGFAFEFGDKIWSLGFASLLNLLQTLPTQIAEAEALRRVEGAQFEALQARIIGQVSQAKAEYAAALNGFEMAKNQQNQQDAWLAKTKKQFDAGLLDRLEMTQAELQNNLFTEEILQQQLNILRAADALEDVLQRDLQSKLFQSKLFD